MSDILVSGLTIIRNGVKLNYPFMEVIRSGLSICDEYIIVAGDSDDDTLAVLATLDDSRIRIIHTTWSPLVTPRKCLLAQQTNIGLAQCAGRWCLYQQGNEVLHEKDLAHLRRLMEEHAHNHEVEAMLVERLTFWADFDHYVAAYPRRHKYTARIIRPHIGTYSIRDGMSFAIFDDFSTHGRYPRSIDTGVDMYRYDFVHSVEHQVRKFSEAVHRAGEGLKVDEDFFYKEYPRQFLARFQGTHPRVMHERQQAHSAVNSFDPARCRTRLNIGERARLVETYLYNRFGLPRSSRNRFKLLGSLVRKNRPDMGLLSGTLNT
ncbi:MAG: glycosyltransferase family A protein [Xanthomonadales bacterium]|nr:glycosyltransferase family A protein [Xanthomonadales bacterium]